MDTKNVHLNLAEWKNSENEIFLLSQDYALTNKFFLLHELLISHFLFPQNSILPLPDGMVLFCFSWIYVEINMKRAGRAENGWFSRTKIVVKWYAEWLCSLLWALFFGLFVFVFFLVLFYFAVVKIKQYQVIEVVIPGSFVPGIWYAFVLFFYFDKTTLIFVIAFRFLFLFNDTENVFAC